MIMADYNRLGIERLNEMQETVLRESQNSDRDIVLYSPTGSGKTLAVSIPAMMNVDAKLSEVQAVVIAPSRELALQLYDVIRILKNDLKVTCCYGGHSVEDERRSLCAKPHVVVGTPGRICDHIKRTNIDITKAQVLVIDEFDKTLELGFEDEMKFILDGMRSIKRRFLTSATILPEYPSFLNITEPIVINRLTEGAVLRRRMNIYRSGGDFTDRKEFLLNLLFSLPEGKTLVFVDTRETSAEVYDFLKQKIKTVGLYNGGMAQIKREMSLAMFENGTTKVLISTDLASRGLDISHVDNVIHYNLPETREIWVHRNGRTARVDAAGNIFVILKNGEVKPDFIEFDGDWLNIKSNETGCRLESSTATLYINAGKKEKISRGDILGFFSSKGNDVILPGEIGKITSFDHYTLVAVPSLKAEALVAKFGKSRIKSERVRISMLTS